MTLRILSIALFATFMASDAMALADIGRIFGLARAARNVDRASDAARAAQTANRVAITQRVQAQVRRQEIRRQAAYADDASLTRGVVQVGAVSIRLARVANFANEVGVSSSGFRSTDNAALGEMGANAIQGNLEYFPLLCPLPSGHSYHLPSDQESCLDGSAPTTTRHPIDLSPLVSAEP